MNRKILPLVLCTALLLLQNCRKDDEGPDTSHWDYEHPDWSHVNSDCGGIIQSPINIDTTMTLKTSLPDLVFDYSSFDFHIVDNGHTIQVLTKQYDINNTLEFNDEVYKLKQFHFHAKSEHQVNGNHAPMEVHFVHQNDSGGLLVVGFMVEEGTMDNPIMQLVWDKFPVEEEKEMQGGPIDLSGLFPANLDYYNYIGSLTTPPCSMGLQWILMKTPLMLSTNQIEDFRSKYDHNYRPVQPLNNRLVFEKI